MQGVWKFEDLVAWKLAVQLQTMVDRLCERPAIASDLKFHDQLSDAAASGPRNIAEGFGRYYHPEFARFARIAKASEQEVLNHPYRARNRNYITPAEFEDAAWVARKALKAVVCTLCTLCTLSFKEEGCPPGQPSMHHRKTLRR